MPSRLHFLGYASKSQQIARGYAAEGYVGEGLKEHGGNQQRAGILSRDYPSLSRKRMINGFHGQRVVNVEKSRKKWRSG